MSLREAFTVIVPQEAAIREKMQKSLFLSAQTEKPTLLHRLKNSFFIKTPLNEQSFGAVQKEMDSPNYFKFTSEFKSAKI